MNQTARFFIGQIVRHRKFEYRGVVVDADPEFMQSEEWYAEIARSRPPRDQPWYRVLVDGSSDETYVAEHHLEAAGDPSPIEHPALAEYFTRHEDGRYQGTLTH